MEPGTSAGAGRLGPLLLGWMVLGCAAAVWADADRARQLDLGVAALVAGDNQGAIGAFEGVLAGDRANGRALHGAALAYYRAGNLTKARELFDRAVAPEADPRRGAILNAAAFHVQTHQPMRAARLTIDWFKTHPTPPDEPMLDALGVALSQVDEGGRRLRIFQTYAEQYMSLNAELEATRPGEKRWGAQWMAAEEVDRRLDERDRAADAVPRVQRVIDDLQRRHEQAARQLVKARDLARRGWVTRDQLEAQARELEQLASNLLLRRQELAELLRQAAPPDFPESIPMVELDAPAPTTGATAGDSPPPPTAADGPGIDPRGGGDRPAPPPEE